MSPTSRTKSDRIPVRTQSSQPTTRQKTLKVDTSERHPPLKIATSRADQSYQPIDVLNDQTRIPKGVVNFHVGQFLTNSQLLNLNAVNKTSHEILHPCYCGIAFSQEDQVILDSNNLKTNTLCYGLCDQISTFQKTRQCTTYCQGTAAKEKFCLNFLNSITYMMLMSTKALQHAEDKLRVTKISIVMPSKHDPKANIVVELHWYDYFSFLFRMKISLQGYGESPSLEQEHKSDRMKDHVHSEWDESYITWSQGDFDSQVYRFTTFSDQLVPFLSLFSKRGAVGDELDELDFDVVRMNIERAARQLYTPTHVEFAYDPRFAGVVVRAGFFTIIATKDTMKKQSCTLDMLKAKLIMMPLKPLTLRRHSA